MYSAQREERERETRETLSLFPTLRGGAFLFLFFYRHLLRLLLVLVSSVTRLIQIYKERGINHTFSTSSTRTHVRLKPESRRLYQKEDGTSLKHFCLYLSACYTIVSIYIQRSLAFIIYIMDSTLCRSPI